MRALYSSDNEYLQHSNAIHSLANQHHITESRVREIYEVILQEFKSKAKFKKYLLILVTKHVKDLLKKL